MSIDRKAALLLENTPPSVSYDAKVQSIMHAWDRQAQEVIDAIDEVIIIPNIAKIVDSRLIDLLAWQFHVDFYEADAPLELRRELVLKSLEWHTYKGTRWVVEDILHTVFETGIVLEWFEYNPKPHENWHDAYRFKILVPSGFAEPEQVRRLFSAINVVKPASRWLDQFVIPKTTTNQLYLGLARIHWIRTIISLGPTKARGNIFAGLALAHYLMIIIAAPEI